MLSEFEDMLTSFPFNKEEYTQQDLYYDGVYGGQNLDGFYRVVFPYGITVNYECTSKRVSRTSCDSGKRIKNIHLELFDKRSLNGLNRLSKHMRTGIAAGNLLHLFDDIAFVVSEVVFRDHKAYNRLVQLRYKDSFGERVLSSSNTVVINLSGFTFIDELDASFASKIYLDSNAVHSFFDSANSRKTIILPLNLERIDSGALSTEGYSEDGIFIHDAVK